MLFQADWCLPCRAAGPALEAVAPDYPGVRFATVDVLADPQLAAAQGIVGLPALLVLRGGQVLARRVGLAGEERLRALLDSFPPG